jgi:hypothetical protein
MIYVPNLFKPFLLLHGGYSYIINESKIKMQYSLSDMWIYYIKANAWRQVFPNSNTAPGKVYGASLVPINDYQFLLYGGVDSDKVFNELWVFNSKTNTWNNLKPIDYGNWPSPVKHATLISFSDGIVLYGGSYWTSLRYSEEYSNIIAGNRLVYFNKDTWVINTKRCPDSCNSRGSCFFGKCKCNAGYYGSSCEKEQCKSSVCYYDTDLFADENCYHCSGNGMCIDKACACLPGWVGENCSIRDCKNNCSGYGYCQIVFPIAQCICNQQERRGGDDCSIIFCLNNCTNGVCDYKTGVCKCNSGWYGVDCSIRIIPFRNDGVYFNLPKLLLLMLIISLI